MLAQSPLSVLMAIFPREPGLAGFSAAKDDESGGDNWSYDTCKYPTPNFYRPDAFPVAQLTVSEHWRENKC